MRGERLSGADRVGTHSGLARALTSRDILNRTTAGGNRRSLPCHLRSGASRPPNAHAVRQGEPLEAGAEPSVAAIPILAGGASLTLLLPLRGSWRSARRSNGARRSQLSDFPRELARRTGRFPQLVDSRSGVNRERSPLFRLPAPIRTLRAITPRPVSISAHRRAWHAYPAVPHE